MNVMKKTIRVFLLIVAGALLHSMRSDAYTVMNKCSDIMQRVKRNRNTFALFYDGFTRTKKNTLRRIEDSYNDLDINFIAVNVANNDDLRRCVNELGVQDFPSFTLFDHTGGTKVAADDPNEDMLKRMLNEELSTQPGNRKFFCNQVHQLSQAYGRNYVSQRILPTTFQDTMPAYKNIMPSTWLEHFPPPDCYSQCSPCDACEDKHGNIPEGGCGGCGSCGGWANWGQ